MKLVIVTGLSGSGKSIALNALEDLGYYCMDNLPVFLLEAFARQISQLSADTYANTAVGLDARNPAPDLAGVAPVVSGLRASGVQCDILFLEADDEILIQRFSETRRRHPLTSDAQGLADAIAAERRLLEAFRSAADLRVDTSHTNQHELRDIVRSRVAERHSGELSLLFESFGFKHGVPRDADFVYDARCLPNPHWQPELRPLTGKDEAVARFLAADTRVDLLLEHIRDFLGAWIPCFEAEGRSYLTVAVGCTGGQHRSVFLVDRLAEHFRDRGRRVVCAHRELK